MGSTKVRFAFQILHCIASRIDPSLSSLKWLSVHSHEVVKLAEAYKAISEMKGFAFITTTDEDTLDLLSGRYSQELLDFLKFIRKLKFALRTWTNKLRDKQMRLFDIAYMFESVSVFQKLTSVLGMALVSVKDEDVISVRESYNTVVHRLSDLLLKSVDGHPELQW